MEEQIEKLGTIVSIWAHPDDETYLAGGIMAAAAELGQRVVCVSATEGEHGTDDPVAWPPERLGRTRRWEAAAAMAVLGVTDHRFLGYPDGGMAALDPEEPVARIAALLVDVAPDTVLTFGPDGGTFHPDHQTISAWVGAAWERAGRPGRLLHATMTAEHLETWGERYEQWRVFMTDERPVGVTPEDLALDLRLTGVALDRKIAALLAMHTQVAPAVALLGIDDYRDLNAGEAFIEAP
ncbi:PIG-L deacetylase family protein [Dactylosporangium siamense]|uniref:1D-myo-inositol 2-acetamido-2-deoxy-alpha-D-glucopyranoside deacetylase n=1 Tax=Dactylosporangium siamense TaxID=685454 RepID=A0A919PXD7_9ACTN|nr:PIG-L family deacetylase [Dactylosporangium siamense]GIG51422.1 1D-myo-inositol 2-acetamido-2-deoxy-alpha-D-glucopyranoside deacetylase [Dactylosporangium siamense]